ncbi:hypothetical protein KKF59_03940 [Patescibacteria group bacterium]|nr:hypothetical protein [Patescibacteria group bacterium]MBU1034630.1 hypothetical protein [Patescibacteria group bacterium]MBU1630033.1 hypothetical protein [Patescibacteria group bacterium]MBU1908246.1 hypothetical protein [Patescibacteria group bacterium]
MMPTLENPFAKEKHPIPTEPPEVGEVEEALLGKEEADEMRRRIKAVLG